MTPHACLCCASSAIQLARAMHAHGIDHRASKTDASLDLARVRGARLCIRLQLAEATRSAHLRTVPRGERRLHGQKELFGIKLNSPKIVYESDH